MQAYSTGQTYYNAIFAYKFLLSIGMTPLVELSFVPNPIANGTRTWCAHTKKSITFFIIFDTKSLVFGIKFLGLNTKFIIFQGLSLMGVLAGKAFTTRAPARHRRIRTWTSTVNTSTDLSQVRSEAEAYPNQI